MKSFATLLLAAVWLLPFGCQPPPTTPKEDRVLTRKATTYPGSLAREWAVLTGEMIRENNLSGPQEARIYGYLGLTLWESVQSGVPGAKSMAGQINDYQAAAPVDMTREYDWGIVLCTAVSALLPELVEQITAGQRDRIEILAIMQESKMVANGVPHEVNVHSKALGQAIGTRIVQRMHNDGRDMIRQLVPVVLVRDAEHPWYWSPNMPGQQPLEPLWGTLRTFVLDDAQSCTADAAYAYSEQPGTAFYMDAQEVYASPRTGVNRNIAYHWEDGSNRTGGPASHWMGITTQLLADGENNLAECAKTYCLVGTAVADAFSVTWHLKYKYNQLLPVTYVREQINPNWKPWINNPPYPEYTSAAAAMGGAVPVVLASVLEDVAFVDRTQLGSALYTPDGGPFVLPERPFLSLTMAGEEQAMSGLRGGTQFRRACELGLQSGRCVGNAVASRLLFGF